jgi:hypothetical protein
LKTYSIKNVSDKLNVCVGTIRRWRELRDVPRQYTFDIYKILSKEIDYSKYNYLSKDLFFTPENVVKMCWSRFRKLVDRPAVCPINILKYTFIEPSAGDGSFMKILPEGTIGLDIEPRADGRISPARNPVFCEVPCPSGQSTRASPCGCARGKKPIQKNDYLLWEPENKTKKYIVFGNPPFGLRGHLALKFINHSYDFADYVCFILPQLFNSNGKGSPRKRVKYNLIHSENLSSISFRSPSQEVKVNCVFQIWAKHTSNPEYELKKNSEENMKIYSLSDGELSCSRRNKGMIGHCDIYLPSTCFGREKMRLYSSFNELPNKKGYGVVFFNNKTEMIEKASKVNWADASFLSTNSACNLRTSIIMENLV